LTSDLCERICRVLKVVRHVKELPCTAFDESVQRVLHQLQVVHLPLELALPLELVLPHEAGGRTAASGQATDREQRVKRSLKKTL